MEENTGTLAILDRTGDTKLIWDRAIPAEVENARRTFDDLRGKSFFAYRVTGKKGARGEQITEFDPTAERIILVPPMQGG